MEKMGRFPFVCLEKNETKLLTNSIQIRTHSATQFQQLTTKLTKNRHCSTDTNNYSDLTNSSH